MTNATFLYEVSYLEKFDYFVVRRKGHDSFEVVGGQMFDLFDGNMLGHDERPVPVFVSNLPKSHGLKMQIFKESSQGSCPSMNEAQ